MGFYEVELSPGFVLTMRGTGTGKYKRGKDIFTTSSDYVWGSYQYLRIHKCKTCSSFYVIKSKKEIILKIKSEKLCPVSTIFSICDNCTETEKGMDLPLDEFPIGIDNIRKVFFR